VLKPRPFKAIYRASVGNGAGNDVVCFLRMRLLQRQLVAVTALVWLSGCASIGPPLPPSLEVPKPPADLRAARKGDRVTLTWTVPPRTTDRQRVRFLGKTRVCRGFEPVVVPTLKECGAPVGQVPPPADFSETNKSSTKKLTASFTDTLGVDFEMHNASGSVTYAVEVLNRDGRGAGLSNQVHVPLAPALPAPKGFGAQVTAAGVVLTWIGAPLSIPLPNPIRRSYRVYRRVEGSQQKILVGEQEAGSGMSQSVTDQSFEWEKTYYYHADTLTVISRAGKPDISIEGDDTPEVKVLTHDVFPPAVPAGLQAVFSGPGQRAFVDLIWAPVTDADLGGYNVYRHEEGGAAVRVNLEPVKLPTFRDLQVVTGKTYFYSVSAVDLRGNESGRSAEAGESVP
jgi:hypothetical protein